MHTEETKNVTLTNAHHGRSGELGQSALPRVGVGLRHVSARVSSISPGMRTISAWARINKLRYNQADQRYILERFRTERFPKNYALVETCINYQLNQDLVSSTPSRTSYTWNTIGVLFTRAINRLTLEVKMPVKCKIVTLKVKTTTNMQ